MKTKHIVGLGLVVAALGYLIMGGLGNNLVYFLTPSEYFQEAAKYEDRPVRLGGLVKIGTVQYNQDTLVLNFTLTDGVREVQVSHTGTPPALFKENQGVVVEGRFVKGNFSGNNLLVKHSENYQADKQHGYTPEEIRKLLQEAN